MTGGRDRRTTTREPLDDEVYELDLENASTEEALRDAVEAADRADGGDDAPAAGGSAEPPGAEFDAMREKYLRALADFDNYRKRVERERGEAARSALVDPLRQFLGVVDNLDRALKSGGSFEDLKSGVEMIQRQTTDLLRRFGVEEVQALGEPFDPAFHEAVIRYEDPGVDEPRVSEEFQRGYRYQGRLLRPAMVKVAVPVEGGGSRKDDEADA